MKDLIGRRLGNFIVKALLDAGAMGTVYVGEHAILGHKVAIKVMQAAALAYRSEEGIQRFITEARVLTELGDSPHIIKLFDFGELDGGVLYYVMEYLEGHDLEEELRGRLPLSPLQALSYVDAIGAGLAAAHAKQIVHRDLKPSNIFVVISNGKKILKLIDFGLAKDLGSKQKLTLGGMGTPIYSAPEQVQPGKDPIGPTTDLYALGVLVYQMLSGSIPFDIPADAHPYAALLAPVRERRIPLCERRPEIPAALGRFVDGSLARAPADRPASVKDFLIAYRQALAEAGIAEIPPIPSFSSVQAILPLDPPPPPRGLLDALLPREEESLSIAATEPLIADNLTASAQDEVPGQVEGAVETEPERSEGGSSLTAAEGDAPSSTTLSSSVGEVLGGSLSDRRERSRSSRSREAPTAPRRIKRFIGGVVFIAMVGVAVWATRRAFHTPARSRRALRIATRPSPVSSRRRLPAREVRVPVTWKTPPRVQCEISLDGRSFATLPPFFRVSDATVRHLHVICPGFAPLKKTLRATDTPLVLSLVPTRASLPKEESRSAKATARTSTSLPSPSKGARARSASARHLTKRRRTSASGTRKLLKTSPRLLQKAFASSPATRKTPSPGVTKLSGSSDPVKPKSPKTPTPPEDDPGDVVGP